MLFVIAASKARFGTPVLVRGHVAGRSRVELAGMDWPKRFPVVSLVHGASGVSADYA